MHPINRVLAPLGVELRRTTSTWDVHFRQWIDEAARRGVDPNDVGDAAWGADQLTALLADYYLPVIRRDATVLELGPGTGRLTRHLVGKCSVMVADRSRVVRDWLARYLPGVPFHLIDGPRVPNVAQASVDAVLAHGVMDHLDLDELYWFLVDFHRVLKPRGVVVFTFHDITTPGGISAMRQFSSPTMRSIFRPQHPQAVLAVARAAGFTGTTTPNGAAQAMAQLVRVP